MCLAKDAGQTWVIKDLSLVEMWDGIYLSVIWGLALVVVGHNKRIIKLSNYLIYRLCIKLVGRLKDT